MSVWGRTYIARFAPQSKTPSTAIRGGLDVIEEGRARDGIVRALRLHRHQPALRAGAPSPDAPPVGFELWPEWLQRDWHRRVGDPEQGREPTTSNARTR